MLVRENMHVKSTYICRNIAYNPELSHIYSLYTIYTCNLYFIRSVYMPCRNIRSENRPQVVYSRNNMSFVLRKKNSLLREGFVHRGRSFRNRKFVARGSGEFSCVVWGVYFTRKRDFFSLGVGVAHPSRILGAVLLRRPTTKGCDLYFVAKSQKLKGLP